MPPAGCAGGRGRGFGPEVPWRALGSREHLELPDCRGQDPMHTPKWESGRILAWERGTGLWELEDLELVGGPGSGLRRLLSSQPASSAQPLDPRLIRPRLLGGHCLGPHWAPTCREVWGPCLDTDLEGRPLEGSGRAVLPQYETCEQQGRGGHRGPVAHSPVQVLS